MDAVTLSRHGCGGLKQLFIAFALAATACGLITPFDDRPTPGVDGDGDGDGDIDADGDGDGDIDADGDGDGDPDADGDNDEECRRDCVDRQCGPDRCGGSCGPGCDAGMSCSGGQCVTPTAGEWIEITVQAFIMGSPEEELGHQANETLHQVTLTHDFLMLSTEVNQAQFETWMGYNFSHFSDDGPGDPCGVDCPAERVSWSEAAAACNVISAADGFDPCYDCDGEGLDLSCAFRDVYPSPYDCPGYRLPTEAEWEYAARAGTASATYNGDLESGRLDCDHSSEVLTPIAWSCHNGDDMSHPIAQLRQNHWGLYDMLGNVWEWTNDRCSTDGREHCQPFDDGPVVDPFGQPAGAYQVIRGGGFSANPIITRSANRGTATIERNNNLGFRPVRTIFR
jgi:formylglycine-generating enzyme required for sulfatase activity